MKKVVIYHNYPQEIVDKLNELHKDFTFIVCTKRDELEKEIGDAEVLVGFKCDADMLIKAPNLKWIQSIRAGVDAMPLEEIKNRRIILTSGRGVHKIHMAEYAIAAMIMLARDWHFMMQNQVKGKWDRSAKQREIYGSTLGILGLGSIGTEIAKKAKLFGMRVIAVRQSDTDSEFVDKIYKPADMEIVFKESDYIINLLPSTEETKGIINNKYFRIMKEDACFINMGRGNTVHEVDLVAALNAGKIRAMVSDVFEKEPLPSDSPLWKLDNVILTPHICGESYGKYEEKTLEILNHNLNAYAKEKSSMINVIDLDKGY